MAGTDHRGMVPAFSGGTSLSKGWELIKRFSEDIDFKVGEPPTQSASRARRERTAYRERVLAALADAGFEAVGKPAVGNESRFFSAGLSYPAEFGTGRGLRPHIRIEMSFGAPALPPVSRTLRSFIAAAQSAAPEVADFACVDAVETAADKLSALARRVLARDRRRADDDPTIIRHLHDLAALEGHVAAAPRFRELVLGAIATDIGRGGITAGTEPAAMLGEMIRRLESDPLWAREYEDFVHGVSFAAPGETLGFGEALANCRRRIAAVFDAGSSALMRVT